MQSYIEKGGLKRHILIVDDELINREILGNLLSEDYEVHYAENGIQALQVLRESECIFSLILLDLLMPVMDGFQLIEKLKADEKLRTIPVIVMTSEADAEVKSIKLGAADFITKPYDMPEVILARCERTIELQEDKTIILAAEKDHLTGLYTKDFFAEYIRQIEKYTPGKKMDIMVVNIDHFHLINELYGRREGDKALKCIADTLSRIYADIEGIRCRTEADYFYVYSESRSDYDNILKTLLDELAKCLTSAHIRLRMGVYSDADKALTVENWLDRAKTACDRIRGDHSRHIAYYNKDFYERSKYQEKLIHDIDDAIANRDLIVFYQPKYGIQGDVPVLRSAEALIRWKHPELGMISPGDFIPLFESNGLIQKLDRYVWKEAARQIGEWKKNYSLSVPVSVNVSRMDIYYPRLRDNFHELLDENGLETSELMLEITESAYADNAEQLVNVIEALRNDGFVIEMDDFGSGYSSLNMLTTIPIDALKMDMKFIRNMQKDEKSMKLVELVMDIAKFLQVPVIAEGVETEEQLHILKNMGCDIIQGYYFSKPVPAEDFKTFIEKELSRQN
ncbi:diguanylate cyclase (GGDEF) domain-containing protein [Eubacterium ruminantium]|nr:diguanylate cyclase (GGDEF) domain-containing protein [Eubacterium ruminantium]